jgi:hypothetical protein
MVPVFELRPPVYEPPSKLTCPHVIFPVAPKKIWRDMSCRSCALPVHAGRCDVAMRQEIARLRNQIDAINSHACNQCVTKDAEMAGLRNQVEELKSDIARHVEIASVELPENTQPKRDRAAYMRAYRASGRGEGIAYG